MYLKRLIAVITVLIIVSLPYSSASNSISSEVGISDAPSSHLIEGVPYIAQTQGYFCGYACRAMILNYLGFDTSLEDILFYDGLGYTHYYHQDERLPEEGRYSDLDYVLNLFGVKQNWWCLSLSEECWNIYFSSLKENISSDIPVITIVDPFSMPSLRNQFRVPDYLWEKLFPPTHHLILVIGYNEDNHSICYNDPNAGFYGDGSYGDHAWIDMDDFKKAVVNNSYENIIFSTINVKTEPSSKQIRFTETFKQNIVKLEGNYEDFYYTHGINASKKMKTDFSPGENNRSETIKLYKKDGDTGFNFTVIDILYRLFLKLTPNRPSIFDIFIVPQENSFEGISKEKQEISEYLEQSIFYPDFCKNQSILLKQESELWHDLSNYYKVFMRRGIFLLELRSNILMNKMENTIDKIILIEQQLINEANEFLYP